MLTFSTGAPTFVDYLQTLPTTSEIAFCQTTFYKLSLWK